MGAVTKLIENEHSDTRHMAVTIVSKVLGMRNQRLTAHRYANGMILTSGGATKACINRLHRMGDCVTPQALRTKETAMSSLTSHLTADWDVVFDNVNPYVKPRHQTATKGNKLYSMTHSLMIKDRVPTAHLLGKPKVPLEELEPFDVLPSTADTC